MYIKCKHVFLYKHAQSVPYLMEQLVLNVQIISLTALIVFTILPNNFNQISKFLIILP